MVSMLEGIAKKAMNECAKQYLDEGNWKELAHHFDEEKHDTPYKINGHEWISNCLINYIETMHFADESIM